MNGAHLTGWRLNAGDELTVMDGAGARLVSVNCGGPTGRTVKEGEDCARVIAAAPELLEALERVIEEVWGDWHSHMDREQFERHFADEFAAIAKARGGSA